MTKQRETVLAIIRESDCHLTAEEIYMEAKKRLPTVSLATVYNSLRYLTENDIILRLHLPGQPDRYDKALAPHDHIVCDRCGALLDIRIDGLPDILRAQTGLEVSSYSLILHALCPACRGKK